MFIGNTILIYTVFMAHQNGTPKWHPKMSRYGVTLKCHVTQNGTPKCHVRGGQKCHPLKVSKVMAHWGVKNGMLD